MTTLGPFTDLRPLGCGAMSDVYAARDSRSGRTIALKVARPGTEARLLHEARVLAQIRHPGVVRVLDCGVCDGATWLSMERLRGVSLRVWATAGRSANAIAAVFDQLATAVDAVHRAGLLHRDIKPDNVLVGEDGRVCLLDFGLAVEVAAIEDEEAPAGTPLYMAPELLEGRCATRASDQYALAVSMYETLSGRLPFRATTLEVLRLRIAAGAPKHPLARAGAALRSDVLRGFQQDPSRRFASVAAFRTAVVQHARSSAAPQRFSARVRNALVRLSQPRLTPAYG